MTARAWLARWVSLAWPALTLTALSFVGGVLTVSQLAPAQRLIPGFALMAYVVIAITGVLAGVSLRWPSGLVRGVILSLALILGTTCMLTQVLPDGLSAWGPWRILSFGIGLALIAVILDAILGAALRNWRQASAVRADLEQSLAQESHLNLLLLEAERDRFANYAQVLQVEVSDGLDRVAAQAPSLSDLQLADEINGFVARVMRPLAHLLHPVTVRAGLIPALRALGPRFDVRVDDEVEADDVQGVLLDEHVRHQVYRWLRHVRPLDSVTIVTFARAGDDLVVIASGMGSSRPLDAIQRVAGLRVVGASTLKAPLAGSVIADVVWSVEGVIPAVRRPLRMPSLSTPPVLSMPLLLLVGLASLAVQTYLTPGRLTTPDVVANVISFAAAIVVALVLRAAPLPTSERRATLWVASCWLTIGVASGLSAALAIMVLWPEPVTTGTVVAILVRGTLRYSLAGIGLQIARGYAAQAEADGERLRASIVARRRERERVLELTDQLDRFISESLHRSVQGRLSAASLLARLGRRDEAISELEGVRSTILPALIDRLSTADLSSALTDDSTTSRGGILDDRVDWSALEQWRPQLASDLRKVVGECVVNAQRHGRAGRLVASVTRDGDQVTLTCVDDGVGASKLAVPGLGSQIFDEVADRHGGSWSLERTSDGMAFCMRVHTSVRVG